jgi:hypothetical protein
MVDSSFLVIALTIGFIITMVDYYSSKAKIVEGKLKQTPLINDYNAIKDGDTLKIRGELVFAGRTLNAPYSKRKCAYYFFNVIELIDNDYNSGRSVKKIIHEEKRGDIIIKNNDYYAIIDAHDSEIFLAEDELYSSSVYESNPKDFFEYLEKNKIETKTYWGNTKKYEYDELILNEGKTISVYGKAKWVSISSYKNIQLNTDKLLLIYPNKTIKEKVYISDSLI